MTKSKQTPRLLLVGDLYIGAPDNIIPFLVEIFDRSVEVEHTGGLTRQVQYASGANEDDYIQFMGFEVKRVEGIPERMMAWRIDGDSWSVIQAKGEETEVIWQEAISWKWLDLSIPERPCGEFSAKCPAEWNNSGLPTQRDFRIVSNSYLGLPGSDEIRLVDYDKSWPEKYERMKQEILHLLGPGVALRIEHYGSTSIPGMPAKPIVDILLEIPSWEEGRKCAIPAFNTPEIEYWFYNGHMCFIVRDKATGTRTHHIHMAPGSHAMWEGLAFRDYMRTHPEDAARYAALKLDLAECYQDDREGYTDAKTAFVREITDNAVQEKG